MFFHSSPFGLSFTSGSVQLVGVHKHGKGGKIFMKEERAFSDDAPREESLTILKELAHSAGSEKDVILCLPSERVYLTWVNLSAGEAGREAELHEEIDKLFPEERANLHILTRVFRREKGLELVAVAAASLALIDRYRTLATDAGFHVVGITSSSAIIGGAVTGPGLSLLATRVGTQPLLTVFFDGWPIDESILQSGASDERIAEQVVALSKEYEAAGLPFAHVFLLGNIQQSACAALSVPAEVVLPWIPKEELPFAVAAAASRFGTCTPNFLIEEFALKLHAWTLRQVAASSLVLCAVIAGGLLYGMSVWPNGESLPASSIPAESPLTSSSESSALTESGSVVSGSSASSQGL